jgi:4-oxalocrotonate tautomerase family enzyme
MPIVSVQLFPGRDMVMKEFLGRAIVDAVSEIAGTQREAVHVIFNEVPADEWAIGLGLVANRPSPPPAKHIPANVSVERATLKNGKRSGYVAWRREVVLPFLASQEGFLSSALIGISDDSPEVVIIEKWTSREARGRCEATPAALAIREAEQEFVDGPASNTIDGHVVDVFHGRT